MSQTVYLDNHSTAQSSEAVNTAILSYHREKWGIPTLPHGKGQELIPDLKRFYDSVYRNLNARDQDRFVLTSGATEAINHIVFSVYNDVTRGTGKNHFLTANTSEAPAIMAMGQLEKWGCAAKMVPTNAEGQVTAQAVADELSPRTALVSVSWANGLSGVVNPIHEIAELCQSRGVFLHVDATHAIGKLYIDFEDSGADFMTFSATQIHGPRGVGALLTRNESPLSPLLYGGTDQGGMRAGSLNVPGLAGLATALEESVEHADHLSLEIARLRDRLESELEAANPEIRVLFRDSERLPNTAVFLFPGVANDALLFSLAQHKVCASFGGGNFQRIALILEASGIESGLANTALSFALSRYNNDNDIDHAVEVITAQYQRLRSMSGKLLAREEPCT